jgi:hypothetical protein
MEEQFFTEERMATHTAVNVSIYFNQEMDDKEVQDFVDTMLQKYNHPDHIVKDYEYWHDES